MGVGIAGNNTTVKYNGGINVSSGSAGALVTVAAGTYAIVTIIGSGQVNLTNSGGGNVAIIAAGGVATSVYLGEGNAVSNVSGNTSVYGAIFTNSP